MTVTGGHSIKIVSIYQKVDDNGAQLPEAPPGGCTRASNVGSGPADPSAACFNRRVGLGPARAA